MKLPVRFMSLYGGLVLAGTVAASGLPVIDAASIEQAILTLDQLKEEYKQLQKEYESMTGSRGYGDLFDNGLGLDLSFANLDKLANFDFAGQLEKVMDNGVASLSADGKKIFDRYALDKLCTDFGPDLKNHCLKQQAVKAERYAAYTTNLDNIKQAQSNIDSMRRDIKNTDDPKSIAELQARIAVEQAYLDSAVSALEVLQRQQQVQQQIMNDQQDALTRSMFKVENNPSYESMIDGSVFR